VTDCVILVHTPASRSDVIDPDLRDMQLDARGRSKPIALNYLSKSSAPETRP
jgi:hypothetical protein